MRWRITVFTKRAQAVYQFFWGDFCDWYIEWVKPDLLSEDREKSVVAWKNLFAGFEGALRLAAPVHAVLDGRVVAPVAAEEWREVDCAGEISGGAGGMEG